MIVLSEMSRILLLIFVTSFSLVSCQTTEYSYNYTLTYNPPFQDCLPYDGSVVPDCSKYVDPITKQPYYHEHSNSKREYSFESFAELCFDFVFSVDCSRYWECGPNDWTCLLDCASCQHSLDEEPQCAGRWALSFDDRYAFPLAPICDWPAAIECSVFCPETGECQLNSDCDCDGAGGSCNVDCTCSCP